MAANPQSLQGIGNLNRLYTKDYGKSLEIFASPNPFQRRGLKKHFAMNS